MIEAMLLKDEVCKRSSRLAAYCKINLDFWTSCLGERTEIRVAYTVAYFLCGRVCYDLDSGWVGGLGRQKGWHSRHTMPFIFISGHLLG